MKKTKSRMPGVPEEQWIYKPRDGFVANVRDVLQSLRSEESDGNVSRMKNYYLPLIFQAMADLTFFFQAVDEYPELREVYKSDLMNLLGITRLEPRKRRIGFMFENLVAGMISLNSKEEDFRLRLVHSLEELIWMKLIHMRLSDTARSSARILEEILKPMAWTEMLASRVPDIYDFGILRHGWPGEYPKRTEEERNKVFDEQAKRNEPARTFTFKTEELLEI